jgi:N-acetyl sugar amidotransferase
MSNTLFGLPEKVKFCTRCVISNQRPSSTREYSHVATSKKETIHFDSEGVCDACRVAEAKAQINWDERRLELEALCGRFRKRDGSYDCIVPGSGGKDSFFAAHVLRDTYGMHPLLVTWAAHEYTEWGARNLARWQRISDHYLCTPRRDTHRLLTRLAVDNLFHPFQPFIIGQKSLAPKLATLFNIPLVFYGENEAEYGNPVADSARPVRDSSYHTGSDIALGGVPVADLRSQYGLTSADIEPYMPASPEALEKVGVTVNYLGYFLKWRPQDCYYYACQHGDFESAPYRTPGTYSTYSSIDDKVDDLHYWTTRIKFGIGRATYDASQEIRSGEITRDEGVALVKRFDHEYPDRFEKELFEYLSVSGFPPVDREYLFALAEKFRSPHLWKKENGEWILKHAVWQ